MALFDEKILRAIASPESFRRGRQYVSDGAVSKVDIARDEHGLLVVRGKVYGSYQYDTSVTVAADGSEVLNYECDCPYAQGGACKHVVALGLVGARRSSVRENMSPKTKGDDAQLVDMLRRYAAARGNTVSDGELRDIASRLDGLMVGRGRGGLARVPAPRRTQGLDLITLAFDYHRKDDVVRVEALAHYGRTTYPLTGYRPLNDVPDDVIVDREYEEERDALGGLLRYGFEPSRTPGILTLPGGDALSFVVSALPELADRYRVLVTGEFEAFATPKEVNAASEWNFGESKENWLSFSVEWKAGGRELTPLEIESLASGYATHVRAADGTFVSLKNVDALRRYVKAMRGAEGGPGRRGKGAVSLARACELAALAEETEGARVVRAQQAVKDFLRDAKAGRLVREPSIPKKLDKVLRPYQRDGVAWALFLRRYGFGGVLADDMGLGKTLQALAVISTERPKDAGPSLVVCPKTLVSNWIAEARRFAPNLRVMSPVGTKAERAAMLAGRSGKCDLIVTSYSLFQRDATAYGSIGLYYAVLDEAQYVKNAKTSTAVAVKTLRARHRLALTGTPLENGVHELWSLYDFLMPGHLGSHSEFRQEFERPIREFADTEALARLRRRVRPFLLRRTKESVAPELPPRVEQTDWCELTEVQASLYADVLASCREDVMESVQRKGFARSRIVILSALMRLRQACNHPALVDRRLGRGEELSGKMSHALELVREAADGGHKVLLFSQFTSMLDLLREGLDRMGIGHATIEGRTRDRDGALKRFRENADVPVFLLSLRAAGTGLTLTEADTVILFDPWWNPMVERQAMDRAHRIGQTKCVNVHKLATKGTIEERVLALQQKKKAVFDAVVSETADGLGGLTWDDVRGLFEV
jgi:superfamily II DNA or RNA helicase